MDDISTKLTEVVAWLQKEYTGIRTGQAAPALLDNIKVESYGTFMSLQQVGSVSIEDARTLRISMWDNTQVAAAEKAVRDANLGVSVVSDSAGLRVIFPELTSERRVQLLRLAKSKQEDARVSVRAVRDDFMKKVDADKKAGEISEDEAFVKKEKIQKEVDATNTKLDEVYKSKEKEIGN